MYVVIDGLRLGIDCRRSAHPVAPRTGLAYLRHSMHRRWHMRTPLHAWAMKAAMTGTAKCGEALYF